MTKKQKLIRIFEYALQQEETGKSFFQTSLQRMGWGSAVSAFQRLIKEEDRHIKMISKILVDLKRGAPPYWANLEDWEGKPPDFFEARGPSRNFLNDVWKGPWSPRLRFSTRPG